MYSSVFYYSAIPNFGCSARNVTWQYIHNNGHLPPPYTTCPLVSAILDWNRCQFGECTPRFWPFDVEFRHYTHADWMGLGDPYLNRTANVSDYSHSPNWVVVTRTEGGEEIKTPVDWESVTKENFYTPIPDPNFSAVLGSHHDHDMMRRKKKWDVEWLQPLGEPVVVDPSSLMRQVSLEEGQKPADLGNDTLESKRRRAKGIPRARAGDLSRPLDLDLDLTSSPTPEDDVDAEEGSSGVRRQVARKRTTETDNQGPSVGRFATTVLLLIASGFLF